MDYLPALLTLALVWVVVVVSPGPCFLATVQRAASGSRRDGVYVALGIAMGTIVWCTASLLGLSVLFARVVWLYDLVRLGGALYLVYLGIRAFLNARQAAPMAAAVSAPTSVRGRAAWRVGFLTDVSNPKAAAFFASLFAALLPVGAPPWVLAAAVAIVVSVEFGWYCTMACLFSLRSVTAAYSQAQRWIGYVTGGLFVALGMRMAISR